MKTDDLIALIAEAQMPRPAGALRRAVVIAVALSLVATVALMWLTIGPRPDVADALARPQPWAKHVVAAAMLAGAAALFLATLRPGADAGARLRFVVWPVAVLAAVAAVELASVPVERWAAQLFGRNWLECLILLPTLALPALAATLSIARALGAPTRPALAGTAAGLVAGAIGASAYAIHCTDDAAAFVLVWYGIGMALIALAGRALGPRVLVW